MAGFEDYLRKVKEHSKKTYTEDEIYKAAYMVRLRIDKKHVNRRLDMTAGLNELLSQLGLKWEADD